MAKVTREVANRLITDGQITPLEIILATARALWAEANAAVDEKGNKVLNLEKAKEAAVIADRALAYCHARISSIEPVTPPPPETEEVNALEDARRLAFVITQGIRERSKKGLLPKPKKAKAKA